MDRLTEELGALGMNVVTAFSAGEAVSASMSEPPDLALIDADLEDGDHLSRWISARHRATVCLVHEFGTRSAHGSGTANYEMEDGNEIDDLDMVGLVLTALARAKVKGAGRA